MPSAANPAPVGSSQGADELSVHDLAVVNRRLYHATLLAGRTLAAFAPLLGDVAPRAALVRAVHALIGQSVLLHDRLLEMRIRPDELGTPGPAAVEAADDLLAGSGERALVFAAALLRGLEDTFTELHNGCRAEHAFHDRRLYGACLALVAEGTEPYRPHPEDPEGPGPKVVPDAAALRTVADFLAVPCTAGAPTTATGTPALRLRDCPTRRYPGWASFVSAADVEFQDPEADDPARSIVLHALRKGIATEFISTDIPLRNIAEFPDLPLQFYRDMARHAHDELRHTHLLLDHLTAMGKDYRRVAFRIPDTYSAMAGQPLAFRLIVLSRTGEDAAIEALADAIPRLRSTGYADVAVMFDHVLADELRHVAYANHWLRHLHGDDLAVEAVTTRALEQLNVMVEERGLGDYMRREPDHSARRGRYNPDLELRRLAGFSDHDLARMAAMSTGSAA
ncbi:DUF455 family protein [Streptomyces sp. NPDC059564]|uniref:DUF455 family protein n=1 Tax=Streptomyces sp. NPDC059564 TaxID=3346865 RepID=UPI0036C36018